MSNYSDIKFLHVTRLDEVADILTYPGTTYVFPKLDGTNAVVWADYDGTVHAGSRNRELSANKDNAAFHQWALESEEMEPVRQVAKDNPGWAICGEWLTPKTGHIKKYLELGFWIFDVKPVYGMATIVLESDVNRRGGYIPYPNYKKIFDEAKYDKVVPPIGVYQADICPVSQGDLVKLLDNNHFNLPADVVGEGIVIKNYDYVSRYGNYEEAKIVRDEFKADKGKKKEMINLANSVEVAIVDDFVTPSDVYKSMAKVETAMNEPFDATKSKHFGMVLELVYTDLLTEEIMPIQKKYGKYPLTFNMLHKACNDKVRNILLNL